MAPPQRSKPRPDDGSERVYGATRPRKNPGARPAARSGTTSSKPASRPAAAASSAKPATPKPSARGKGSGSRGKSSARMAEVVSGQESDLLGILLIGVGLIVALAVWFKVAGPAGRALADALGWLVGGARYLVPIALALGGGALIRTQRFEQRRRVAVSTVAISLAIVGILHVVKGPEKITSELAVLKPAGGWIGAMIGTPVERAVAAPGAVIIFLLVGFAAALLLTRTSVRTAVAYMRRGAGAAAKPLGRAARKAMDEVTTLSSERDPTPVRGRAHLDGTPGALPRPALYDAEEDDPAPAPAPAPRPRVAGEPALPRASRPLPPPTLADSLAQQGQGELALGPGAKPGVWRLPPLSNLDRSKNNAIDPAETKARGDALTRTLQAHNVDVKMVGMTVGPTVTRYELELQQDEDGRMAKVAAITSLQRDIAYATAATDVRILAPIPGRSAIGVEVPNHTRQLVALGDLMSSAEAKAATHPLEVAIGKDIAGRSVFLNLATTPHLLIAGATGAGKSSGINCIITSLLMRTTPDQVRMILIDPKQVEMGQYNRLPHLLTQPVTNPKKAANALGWAVREMERRYDLLFEVGFRDIGGYNAAYDKGELVAEPGASEGFERLPYIVVVVDELNDLMMVAARDVEESITRIAQKARAVGIHLIVATQRPSVNVITGVIKANVPARMAFAVSSLTDSRVILDQPGAEKLVGKGDMLLLPGNSSVAQRIQGSFVSEEEVRKVVAHWRRQAPEVNYLTNIESDEGGSPASSSGGGAGGYAASDDDDDETLVRQAMELVVRSQLGSTSMLQRKLKVGFARAGRIMDLLEQRGVVGPSEGSKARAVLMTVEEFELIEQAGGDPV